MANLEIQLALHGSLILAVSMASGRFFAKVIRAEQNEAPWRLVHSAGSMGGIALIAIAGVFDHISLPGMLLNFFVWLFITGMWVFLLGMITAAVSGERGFKPQSSNTGKTVYVLYVVGAVTTLLSVVLLSAGFFRTLLNLST